MLPYNGVISGLYKLLIKAILCPRFGGIYSSGYNVRQKAIFVRCNLWAVIKSITKLKEQIVISVNVAQLHEATL